MNCSSELLPATDLTRIANCCCRSRSRPVPELALGNLNAAYQSPPFAAHVRNEDAVRADFQCKVPTACVRIPDPRIHVRSSTNRPSGPTVIKHYFPTRIGPRNDDQLSCQVLRFPQLYHFRLYGPDCTLNKDAIGNAEKQTITVTSTDLRIFAATASKSRMFFMASTIEISVVCRRCLVAKSLPPSGLPNLSAGSSTRSCHQWLRF